MKILIFLLFLMTIASCGSKNTNDCDKLTDGGGTLGSTTYDCPSGDPSASDLVVSQINGLMDIEAGTPFSAGINITNSGSAKIFDFTIESTSNLLITNNTCPGKLYQGDSCSFTVGISENIAGMKLGKITFNDRTGKLNKVIDLNYIVQSSYPQSINQTLTDIDYKTKKVVIGPLVDRFGNVIQDSFKISSSRNVSSLGIMPFGSQQINLAPIGGLLSFFIQTDLLESAIPFDNADVSILSSRIYKNGTTSSKNFSLTFINNKPTISATVQSFNFLENSYSNELIGLKEGEDKRNKPLTYRIISKPLNGVLHNCLNANSFVSLFNCSYTPNKNFSGTDSFSYIVNNGDADSVNVANVNINVGHVNVPPILTGSKSFTINQDESFSFNLVQAFDAEGDNLTYTITQSPTNGSLSCTGFTCLYVPQLGFIGSDVFKYKAKDTSNSETSEYIVNFTIKAINHAPTLGGSISFNTSENLAVIFQLPVAIDQDQGDSLVYKIKTAPSKGLLSSCLNNTVNLSCTYTPNLYENTSEIFSYVAVDSKGVESVPKVVTINISQENSAPYFSNLYQEEQVLPNGSINFAINNAIDPEGNTINYILSNPLPGNGGLLSSCLLSNNLNCSYNAPSGVSTGTYSFQYKAQDSLGLDSTIRTVKMIVGNVNNTPILSGILNVTTNEDENKDFSLIPGTDIETPQQFLKYKLGSISPTKGKIVKCAEQFASTGLSDISCEYQPFANQSGSDSFSYFVIDGRNNQSTELIVSINITAVNDNPSFNVTPESFTIAENQVLDFTINSAIDPENDFISYAIKPGFNIQNGTISAGCISLIGQQNNCKYTPSANFNGQDSFTIQAMDSHGAISEKVINLNVEPVNNEPFFASYSVNKVVQEDGDNQIVVPEANDIDTSADLINYQIVSQPSKGLLSGCLMLRNMKGLNCLYLPYSNEQGLDSFSYKANDGIADSPIVTVNLTIVATNDFPFFEKTILGPIKVSRGDSVLFNLNAAKDVESDSLTYEIISSPGNGTISNCFSGNPLTCTYTANIDFIGEDSFVFRSKDAGISTNTVQVDFIVGDKKNDRIFKVKNKLNIEYAQKQSISVDKNVYSLGDSLVFNMATPTNLYFANSTYMKYADGEMKQILSSPIVNFKAVKTVSNKLYSFDESSSGNFLRIIDKEGLVSSLGYSTSINIFYPKEYNSNIYAGSNRSTLYKVNLIKIGQKDYSWIEPLISKEQLGITSSNKLIEVIGSLNNELYFTFFDDNNLRKLAKIKSNDTFEVITPGFPAMQDILLYENASVSKVYFTAGSTTSKKVYAYNPLEIDSNNKLKAVISSEYIPNSISNPQSFNAQSGGLIIYSDSINNKIAGLDPSIDKIIEYDLQGISNVVVSKLKNRLLTISSIGTTTIYTDNPILNNPTIINNFLSQQAYSFQDDSFLVKKKNIDEFYNIDESTPTLVGYQDSYSFLDNVTSDGVRTFAYKTKNTLNGSVFELFEYKQNMSFELKKGKLNKINGLVTDSLASSYSINPSGQPAFGSINNCMGINSTNLSTDCEYTPAIGFAGTDSFKYNIIKNGVSKEFLVKINVTNSKPIIEEQPQISDIIKINNLNGVVIDYTYFNDELFFAMNRSTIGYLYRYNHAEGLKLIEKSINGFDHLRAYNNFLFYVDKISSNRIKFFDIASKVSGIVFDDSQSPTLMITDLIINNNKIFAIAKNYGSTLISRMLKIRLSDYHMDLSAMPANYENGKFIRLNTNIGIEIENKFSTYNETLDSFTGTITAQEVISVGNTSLNNENQPVFELTKTTGLLTNTYFRTFNVESQSFTNSLIFNFSGARFESFLFKRFAAGSSLTGLFELKDTSDNYSAVLLYRQGLPSNDLFAQDAVNFLPIFNEEDGEYSSSIKTFNDKVYAIKHDEAWSYATFSRIGYDSFFYALNHSTTPITIHGAKDSDLDLMGYSIIDEPAYGSISDCMGLNGSLSSDLSCTYTHTDSSGSVIDSFSYRAFDGYSYSDPKIINIKIRNNAPYFLTNNDVSVNIPINYATSIGLDEGFDDDGNIIYYIITQQPTKGVVAGCALDISQLNLSASSCEYTPNNNIFGLDSFKYRVYDGLSFSVEKTVSINISQNPSPIFFTENQQIYIPKVTSFVITMEKAIDPQGNVLTYSITQNPTNGAISNCFVVNLGKLQCTYTPNNSNSKSIDSFKYKAWNGTYFSTERTISIVNTGSSMTGDLGRLHISESGVSLIKDGFNNLTELSSLSGYSWNNNTKTLTLPANNEYHFESIVVDDNSKLIFKPMNFNGTASTAVGWTRLYSQSSCTINGSIKLSGVQGTGGSDVPVLATAVDNESLSFVHKAYNSGVYGGLSGGNSNLLKNNGQYGLPTYFQGGAGQLSIGDIGVDSLGGERGFDGNGIFFKCIDSLTGYGIVDVSGSNGTNGQEGQTGGQDDINRISFGGQGGSGGGNGGQGGVIKIRSAINNFNGNFIYNKGKGGSGGAGGIANTTYSSPYTATRGTSGQNGFDGFDGACFISDLNGVYNACN